MNEWMNEIIDQCFLVIPFERMNVWLIDLLKGIINNDCLSFYDGTSFPTKPLLIYSEELHVVPVKSTQSSEIPIIDLGLSVESDSKDAFGESFLSSGQIHWVQLRVNCRSGIRQNVVQKRIRVSCIK